METHTLKVNGRATRTIWLNADGWGVDVIDQRWLPHAFRVETLRDVGAAATAIRDMQVRGAPLIGAPAAYGVALALREDPSDANLDARLRQRCTRPGRRRSTCAGRSTRMLARLRTIAPGRARRGRLCRGRRDRRRGRGDNARDRPARRSRSIRAIAARKSPASRSTC